MDRPLRTYSKTLPVELFSSCQSVHDLMIATPLSKTDNALQRRPEADGAQLRGYLFHATIGSAVNDRNGRMCGTCGCGHEPGGRGAATPVVRQQGDVRCPRKVRSQLQRAKAGQTRNSRVQSAWSNRRETARRKGRRIPKDIAGPAAETEAGPAETAAARASRRKFPT
jgi:hypothetical protein